MPKYLFTFQKTETVRWLGHLDILRTFERAIRRASLPIVFSSGFNPRERITFASALSTGVTGGAELAVLELSEPVLPEDIVAKLNAALPPAIQTAACEEIPDAGARDLLNAYDQADYEVVCALPAEVGGKAVAAAVCSLLAQPSIIVTREKDGKSKSIDLRPLLHGLGIAPELPDPERITLTMRLGIGERGNPKPAEVVAALAAYVPGLKLRRAHRARLHRSEPFSLCI